jgi:hypothetical protein
VQQLGLVTRYRSDEEVKLFCGMLDGLAFLPVSEVPQGLQYLKAHTPEGLEPLIDYFDTTYVSGSYRRIQRPVGPDGVIPPMKMCRIAPLFPPEMWNIHNVTICVDPGITHSDHSLAVLIQAYGRPLTIFEKIRTTFRWPLFSSPGGQPLRKRVHRSTAQLQQKLHCLCTSITDGHTTMEDTLMGLGHCIRWKWSKVTFESKHLKSVHHFWL